MATLLATVPTSVGMGRPPRGPVSQETCPMPVLSRVNTTRGRLSEGKGRKHMSFHGRLIVAFGIMLSLQGLILAQDKKDDNEIVITAARHETDILATPSNTTVITGEEIRASGARTVSDILKTKAGIFVTSNSSTPQDKTLDIRGFNNGGGNGQRVLVMVDGRKTNSVVASSTDWAQLATENIERIEIVRGPLAALHGDTAVAGVINIITRKGEETPKRTLSVEGGSYGTLRESATASGREDKLSYSFMIQKEDGDGYRDNSAYDGLNSSLKLEYDLTKKLKLSLKGAIHNDNRERPGTLTESDIATVGRRGTVTLGDEADIDQYDIDLGAEYSFDSAGKLSLFFVRNAEKNNSKLTFASGATTSDDEAGIDTLNLKYVYESGREDFTNTLTWGIDMSAERAASSSLNDFPGWVTDQRIDYDRQLMGLYFLDEFHFVSLLFSLGARYDRATIDYTKDETNVTLSTFDSLDGTNRFDSINPHAGISYFLSDKTSVYASWARTFRYPNRDELVGFLATALDLRPERAETYEIGLKSRSSKLLSGGITLFTMDVADEIFYRPPEVGTDVFATGDFGQNENVARVRHRGIEVEANSKPMDRLTLFATYTFQKTTIEHGIFSGKEMPITPRHTGTVGATVLPIENCALTLSARGVGSRYLFNDLSNDIPKLGGYWVVDGRLSYKIKRIEFFLVGNNIFDREYFDNGGIGAGPTGIWGAREAFNPAPEASYLIGTALEF